MVFWIHFLTDRLPFLSNLKIYFYYHNQSDFMYNIADGITYNIVFSYKKLHGLLYI